MPVKLDPARFGIPRKTYLRGHLDYIVVKLVWLWEHRDLVKWLKWVYEPPVMRFFEGTFTDADCWGISSHSSLRAGAGRVLTRALRSRTPGFIPVFCGAASPLRLPAVRLNLFPASARRGFCES